MYRTRVLIPFRGQFHFYVNIHRFVYRLRLPPTHPSAIHPCLLNAVYLAACSVIGGTSMVMHEQVFLNRTRQACERSLAYAVPTINESPPLHQSDPQEEAIDGEERIHLWWALTMCEAAISLGAGLPSSAPVEVGCFFFFYGDGNLEQTKLLQPFF